MQNEYKGVERRKFKRVLFTPDRKVQGVVAFESADRELALKIADISLGGLRFMLKREDAGNIKEGDICLLSRIQGELQLELEASLELEIKWIMDESTFQYVMIGCEFKNLPAPASDQLDQFVNLELDKVDRQS